MCIKIINTTPVITAQSGHDVNANDEPTCVDEDGFIHRQMVKPSNT